MIKDSKNRLAICSKGNSKMGNVGNVALSPCVGCRKDVPCKGQCYALKAFRQYAETKAAWAYNLQQARHDLPGFMQGIRDFLDIKRKEPLRFFRWHVSGDIGAGTNDKVFEQSYLDHMSAIAQDYPAVKFLAFTKCHDLNFRSCPDNLRIVLSMWLGFGNTRKQLPRAWMLDESNPDNRIPPSARECFGNCDACGMCWTLKPTESVFFHKH